MQIHSECFEVVTVKGGGAHMFSQSLEGLLILSLPTFFQVSSGCSVNCVSQRLHDLGYFYIAVPMSLAPLIPKSSAGSIYVWMPTE